MVTNAQIHQQRQTAWSWALRNVLLPLGDRAFGQQMIERLRFLERAQYWDQARLHAERDRLLTATAAAAYREVSFYRDLFDGAGVKPSDIQHADDLRKLPIVTKTMMRPHLPDGVTRDTGQKTYAKCSSGSTGAPFCIRETAETAGWYRASSMLNFEWAGWRIGDRHLQMGINLNRDRARVIKDQMMRTHYVSAYRLTDVDLDASLAAIERDGIRFIFGYPSSVYYLAKRAQQVGWNQPIQAIVTWGDNLFAHYRQAIESAFGARVYDKYGCGEGMEVGSQTDDGAEYLINSLDVIVEFVDDDGQPVPVGTPGNILLTRLHAGATPFLRYRLGDVGMSAPPRARADGRGFEMFGGLRGRDTDVIVTPGGNRLVVHFFTGILEYFTEITQFQVIQTDANEMIVNLVAAPHYTPDSTPRILAALRDHGADIATRIELVDEIPLTAAGKRRFVINQMKLTQGQPAR